MSLIGRYRGILNEEGDTLWNPIDLGAAMVLWLDADDDTSQTVTGTQVLEWNDKSQYNRVFTQPLSIRQPTVELNSQNGRRGISFNGFSSSMNTTSNFPITGNPELSAFVIYRKRNLTQGTVYSWGSTELALGSMILFDNNVLTGYAYSGDNNYRIQPVPANTTVIQSHIKAPGSIAGNTIVRRDGADTAGVSHSNLTPNIQAGSMWIGGFNNLAEFYLNGLIYEVIITNTLLPTTLQFTVEGYMAHRWGTEDQLPLSHPFRFFPP